MPEFFTDLWKMITSLQIPDLVLSAAAVLILDLFAIVIIFAAGRESKLCWFGTLQKSRRTGISLFAGSR